jgi:Zn-finger protein
MENSYRYFENRECKFYPCHNGIQNMNCLFCFCPLYHYENCGGNYTFLENNVKNCKDCIKPHTAEGYEEIIAFLKSDSGKFFHHNSE